MFQLAVLRAKHAPRVFELARVALDALNELEQIEDAVDDEARTLCPSYVRDIQDYKLSFRHEYPDRAEEYKDPAPFRVLEQAVTVIADMRKEAEATLALATAPAGAAAPA
jgi:hypothetical protein